MISTSMSHSPGLYGSWYYIVVIVQERRNSIANNALELHLSCTNPSVHVFWFCVSQMVIDTLLLCFCEDMKLNDGSSERPYYMSDSLMVSLLVGDGKGRGIHSTESVSCVRIIDATSEKVWTYNIWYCQLWQLSWCLSGSVIELIAAQIMWVLGVLADRIELRVNGRGPF